MTIRQHLAAERLRCLILTWQLLVAIPFTLASPPQDRPTIGVALSGGGARGLAHIGVLRWLEENRIPVDYLAGTSMGGLIGGLYACGLHPPELEEILGAQDWQSLFRAVPAYSDLSFRRKEDRRRFPGLLQMGWRNGLRVRSGVSDAHFIGLLINRLTLPHSLVNDFDNLPVPFRAVATDLETGERVILGKGSVGSAIQATIAIPGVFPPVEVDNRILADGGLLNNLPADVVKEMGADVVIAVNVGTPLADRESLSSFLGILDQSIGVMMMENVRQNLLLSDIIVTPDLEDYTAADFHADGSLVAAGYQAAQAKQIVLRSLSLNPAEWSAYQSDRVSRRRQDTSEVSYLELRGATSPGQAEIEDRLAPHSRGTLDTHALESDLNSIYGLGRYRSLRYRKTQRDSRQGLLVEVNPHTHGPPFIDLGLTINGSETDNVRFGLASRTTFLDLGGAGTEWRLDLGIGSEMLAATEFYRPVGAGFFVAPRAFTQRTINDLFEQGERTAEYRMTSSGAGLDLGYSFQNGTDEIRLGYEISHLDADVRIGGPLLPSLEGTVGVARLGWIHDGLDSAMVPRQGWRLELQPRWYFQSPRASGGFPQAQLRLTLFQRLGERNSVFFRGEGGTTFGDIAPPAQQLMLGGPFRLGAFGNQELRGSRLVLTSQGYIHQIGSLSPPVGGRVYAGLWHEIGAVFETDGPRDYRNVVSGGILAETFLGPALIGASWGEGGRHRLYFWLGSLF